MTDADEIAREIAEDFEVKEPGISELTEAIVRAMKQARTAGFNEAKERAVAECRAYEKRMGEAGDRRAKACKPNIVARSKESAADDLATALQAMKQGGSDD